MEASCRCLGPQRWFQLWNRGTASCLGLLLALNACHAARQPKSVAVAPAPPDAQDAGTITADSGSDDAGVALHGQTAVYPAAENEFDVPYRGADVSTVLVLDPTPQKLDLHMNVDTTSSFGDEIDELQRELTRTIVPSLRQRIPDASFGVSRFEDFPRAPFGVAGGATTGDRPYVLLTPITDSLSRVTAAVSLLDNPLGDGGDTREAGAESLYQVATGSGYKLGSQTFIAPFDQLAASGGGTLGGVGFRPQALHVVLHATDALSHTPADYATQGIIGTHDWSQVIDALNAISARALAIVSTGCTTSPCTHDLDYAALRAELSNLAFSTGATRAPVNGTCPNGIQGARIPTYQDTCPLVFDVSEDGSGLANTVTDAVVGLLDGVRFAEVHVEVGNDPLGFVARVEASPVAQPVGVDVPVARDLLPANAPDGLLDSYLDVASKNRLGFKVTLRDSRIAPSDLAQRYRVSIRLLGDGVLLEERFLRVVIPAGAPLTAADVDAGI